VGRGTTISGMRLVIAGIWHSQWADAGGLPEVDSCRLSGLWSRECIDMDNTGVNIDADHRIQAPELPKGVHGGVIRNMKACSKAYDAVAEIFAQGDPRRLQAEIAAGSNIWFEVH
jgi:hypothetical protein